MATKKVDTPWHQAHAAPLVLLSGGEDVLMRRAWDLVLADARKHPEAELQRLDAAHYLSGGLSAAVAPSLFSEAAIVYLDNVDKCTDDFLQEALDYVAEPNPGVVVVFAHRGGQRGTKLLKALRAAGALVIDTQVLKKPQDRLSYVQSLFRQAKRKITPGALDALMDALGTDLALVDAGVRQLLLDGPALIDEATVDAYYGGRVEATGFKVADAAMTGNMQEALSLLRHALATGTEPVVIVAALSMKLRALAKVHGLAGSAQSLAGELGMAPWQIDRAKKDVRAWDEVALGLTLVAAAACDEAVKGGGRDPVYAVERFVGEVCRLAPARGIRGR